LLVLSPKNPNPLTYEKNEACWLMPIISALRRLRQKDHEFKVNLSYIATYL
jgi:hypothetical protein